MKKTPDHLSQVAIEIANVARCFLRVTSLH